MNTKAYSYDSHVCSSAADAGVISYWNTMAVIYEIEENVSGYFYPPFTATKRGSAKLAGTIGYVYGSAIFLI